MAPAEHLVSDTTCSTQCERVTAAIDIAALPACVSTERPCRYEPVTASEFLAQRIADGGYMRDEASERGAPR